MTSGKSRWLGFSVLAGAGAGLLAVMSMMTPAFAYGDDIAFIMGGTGNPEPSLGYLTEIYDSYINHPYNWLDPATGSEFAYPGFPGFNPEGLTYPADFWPFTGLFSLTFDAANEKGMTDLNDAIMAQLGGGNPDGNDLVVFGYSQSAAVITLEKRYLDALPVGERPDPNDLQFVLLENINRPDGGILERFHGLYIPFLNVFFNGATPNDDYATTDIAIQYDGGADFPQYPINVLSDLNALLGGLFLHFGAPELTPQEIATGIVQPVSAADLSTTYILIPTQNLPLLDPLRVIPFLGNPLAELIQPDLRVIVDLGYDRTAPQDIPTPIGLFPKVDLDTVVTDLARGAWQGVEAALVSIGLLPPSALPDSYPYLPVPDPSPTLSDVSPLGFVDAEAATAGAAGFDPAMSLSPLDLLG